MIHVLPASHARIQVAHKLHQYFVYFVRVCTQAIMQCSRLAHWDKGEEWHVEGMEYEINEGAGLVLPCNAIQLISEHCDARL